MSDNQAYLANTPGEVPVPLDQSAPDYMQNAVNTLKAMKTGPDNVMDTRGGLKSVDESSYLGTPVKTAGGDATLGTAEWEGDGSYASGFEATKRDES